jgi:CDP-diacylglycerol--serine O-phosphatidyltransferase
VAFLFVVCAAMRLARFNIQSGAVDRRSFAGLPSPSAGGSLACLAYAFPVTGPARWIPALVALFVTALGLLMVSRLRYPSFKGLALRSRRSYLFVLPLAATLVGIAVAPAAALLTLAALYLIAGPSAYVWGYTRAKLGVGTQAGETVVDEPVVR